jgi:hypothetical protein
MPVFGGTTEKLSKAVWPQRRKAYRSRLRSNSSSTLRPIASRDANSSTCTEWSMTSSTGMSGLIFSASPPWSRIASRMAARSTTHGTPVKSCRSTRAGENEISRDGWSPATQPATASTSASEPFRRTFSSRMRSVYGRRATSQRVCSASSR